MGKTYIMKEISDVEFPITSKDLSVAHTKQGEWRVLEEIEIVDSPDQLYRRVELSAMSCYADQSNIYRKLDDKFGFFRFEPVSLVKK